MRFLVLVLIIVAGAGALIVFQFREEPLKVSGTIEADQIRVGSRVGGRVQRVLVEEGQHLQPGEEMVLLEPFDLLERQAEAKLELAARQAAYQKLAAGYRVEEVAEARALRDQAQAAHEEAVAGPRPQEIRAAREALKQAEAEQQLAQKTFERTEELYGKKAASKEDLDQRMSELKVAQAKVDAATAQLALLEEGTRKEVIAQAKAKLDQAQANLDRLEHGYRSEEVAEAKARMQAAQAAVDVLEQQIEELKIISPIKGVVEASDLREGDIIAANAPVISLLDTGKLWVRAYVPGRLLGHVQPGAELIVVADGYPDRQFKGKVVFLAQEGEFTPNNVQTPEERGKRVFRIKVLLEGDTSMLHPGMSGDVYLDPRQLSADAR